LWIAEASLAAAEYEYQASPPSVPSTARYSAEVEA